MIFNCPPTCYCWDKNDASALKCPMATELLLSLEKASERIKKPLEATITSITIIRAGKQWLKI